MPILINLTTRVETLPKALTNPAFNTLKETLKTQTFFNGSSLSKVTGKLMKFDLKNRVKNDFLRELESHRSHCHISNTPLNTKL